VSQMPTVPNAVARRITATGALTVLPPKDVAAELTMAAGRMGAYAGLSSTSHGVVNERFYADLMRDGAKEIAKLRAELDRARRYKHHVVRYEYLDGRRWKVCTGYATTAYEAREKARFMRRRPREFRNVRVMVVRRRGK
jgi:hypothetical protein